MMETAPIGFAPVSVMFGEAAALLLALIFARAALHKFGDAARFTGVLADYQLLPEGLAGKLARVLPVIEIVLAAGLVAGAASPLLRTLSALAAIALLAIYAAAIGANLLRGRSWIDCGCGGAPESLSWWLVGRNTLFVSAGLLAATTPVPPVRWGGHAATVAIALLAFACIIGAEQALANDRLIRRRRAEARSWIFGART